MSVVSRIRAGFLKVSGYLVPLIVQIPPMGVYPALMTLPLVLYLVLLGQQLPASLHLAVVDFVQSGSFFSPLALGFVVVGLALAIFSIVFLVWHRKEGLVTSGPYRFIRHPQYTGFLLLTLGLTAMSYTLLKTTYGMGWLTPEATLVVWFVELGLYLLLALIEEYYLSKKFGEQFTAYRDRSSFLIPMGRLRGFDIPLSVLVLSGCLFFLVSLGVQPFFA
ncbi:MAG: methyltransferase family protein [Promethearchaeota archaeon]